jgi:hypothetical protein
MRALRGQKIIKVIQIASLPGVPRLTLRPSRVSRRLDETWVRRLGADRRGLLSLERHRQAKRIGSGSWTSR